MARANARGARVLVEGLVRGGVADVVLSPGSRNTPLVLASLEQPGLRVHVVLDERVAGFVALGLSRAARRPVALACTSGSAGAHYLPAVVEADRSAVPLVLLTADRPPELHGCGAPQTVDQRRLFGTFVRAARDLVGPLPNDAWALAAAGALEAALGAGGGPVHLNVAFREPLWAPGLALGAPRAATLGGLSAQPETAVGRLPGQPETAVGRLPGQSAVAVGAPPALVRGASAAASLAPFEGVGAPPTALRGVARLAAGSLAALADRLSSISRGVLFCGTDSRLSAAGAAALADRLGWPLLAEAASGVRFGSGSRRVVWAYDALVRAGAPAPDLVLQFGRAPISKPVATWLAEAPTVRVDEGAVRHDPRRSGGVLVVAEADGFARDLVATLGVDAGGAERERWCRAWAVAQADVEALVERHDDRLWEGAVARAVVRGLPTRAGLHLGSSMPIRDVDAFVPGVASDPADALRVFANRGANGIDGAIATAAGEALVVGRVVLLCGDLTFLHDVGGLLAAAELGADLTVVVVDNGGGGIFDFLPIAGHPTAFERCFTTPQSARIDALAAAARAPYARVQTPAELPAALAAAGAHPGLAVVHVVVDRARNVARHHEINAAIRAALQEDSPWHPSSTG